MSPSQKYNAAVASMDAGRYEEAIAAFEKLGDYKDSADKLAECKYGVALALLDGGKYEEAMASFEKLGSYKDSAKKIEECKYDLALALMKAGDFDEAAAAFRELDFGDSAAKVAECETELAKIKYNEALELMAKENYVEAAAILKWIDYEDSAEKYEECRSTAPYDFTEIGDYITFGKFEQDEDRSNGPEPIRWRVLDKQDGKVLIISDKALEKMPFFAIYWKRSTIGAYLQSSFLQDFTAEEKAMLVKTTVTADRHPDKPDTDQGADTENTLFLLSVDEVNRYFKDREDRICYATPHLVAALENEFGTEEDGRCDWWLRTAYDNFSSGAYIANIDRSGGINWSTHNCRMGLRPACWIQLES